MTTPQVEQIAEEFDGQAVFGKIDIDEYPEVATQYGVMSVPALLIFKDGQVVDSVLGVIPQLVLLRKVNDYIRA